VSQKEFLFGVAVGVAAAASVPLFLLALAGSDPRPVSTALRRGARVLRSKSMETVAELGEVVEDMFAEMRAVPPPIVDDGLSPPGAGGAGSQDAPGP